MATEQHRQLYGRGGLHGTVLPPDQSGGQTQVEVVLDDGQRLRVPQGLLQLRPDGSYDLPLGPEDLGQLGSGVERIIPLVQEELQVQTQRRETGRVLVHIVPQVRTESVDVPLRQEHVEVERVPVNRVVDQPPSMRQEGEVTVVPVLEEVLVVQKKLMLKEEIRITRHSSSRQHHEEVPLRREEVHISRSEIPPAP